MSLSPRKLIVMFADVSGSAGLFERLGDTEAMYAVERCLKRMNRSIDGYRGRTVQIVGDELLATFESVTSFGGIAFNLPPNSMLRNRV